MVVIMVTQSSFLSGATDVPTKNTCFDQGSRGDILIYRLKIQIF
jgi:hypothetical protein